MSSACPWQKKLQGLQHLESNWDPELLDPEVKNLLSIAAEMQHPVGDLAQEPAKLELVKQKITRTRCAPELVNSARQALISSTNKRTRGGRHGQISYLSVDK
jgi:hypothetical protein